MLLGMYSQGPMNTTLVPPVSARSALLSLLLGAQPPQLPGREIVAAMKLIGFSESTTRVALSRMVASGDLVRADALYTLSERLIARQESVRTPEFRTWTGTWEMAVVTTTGRSAPERVALRADMARQRVGELREGVWMRPANLQRGWPDRLQAVSSCFEASPVGDPVELAQKLWDLDEWRRLALRYLDELDAATDEPTRFVTMVAAVRHLQTDPLLPTELLPDDWPGQALSTTYDDYRAWLASMREHP